MHSGRAKRAALILALVSALSLLAALVRLASTDVAEGPVPAAGTTYYVDCRSGDNANAGTTQGAAWQTPWTYPSSERMLAGADRLLLLRGCEWGGQETRIVARATSPSVGVLIGAYGPLTAERPTLTNAIGSTPCRTRCGPMDWNPTVLLRVIGSHVTVEGLRFVGVPDGNDESCAGQPTGNHSGVWFEGDEGGLGIGNQLRDSELIGFSRGAVVAPTAHDTRIHSNAFRDNNMMSILDRAPFNDGGAVAVELQGSDNEVDHNEFSGQDGCSYDYLRDGSAVEVWGAASGNDVHHNRAIDNESFVELGKPEQGNAPSGNHVAYNQVIGIDAEGSGQAFLVTRGAQSRNGPVHRTLVINNSVLLPGRRARGIVCDAGCGAETLTVANNIIWSEGDGPESHHGAISCDVACSERANIVWSSDTTPYVTIDGRQGQLALGEGSMMSDPHWFAPEQGDLRLKPDSPAIDGGAPMSGDAYLTDLAGTAVPSGAALDIGAFEAEPGDVPSIDRPVSPEPSRPSSPARPLVALPPRELGRGS